MKLVTDSSIPARNGLKILQDLARFPACFQLVQKSPLPFMQQPAEKPRFRHKTVCCTRESPLGRQVHPRGQGGGAGQHTEGAHQVGLF